MSIHITETHFLNNLQYLCRRHGFSQKDVAEKLGISLPCYKKRFGEQDDVTFTVDELLALCMLFFVKLEELICLDLEDCIDNLDSRKG